MRARMKQGHGHFKTLPKWLTMLIDMTTTHVQVCP